MRQQDRFRQAAERAHKRAYDTDEYTVELFNYSGGSYDPNEGRISGESRTSIGTVQAEIVPPEIDATVRIEGTSFSFDTSIRFPQDEAITSELQPLGEDNERPTEVEITDEVDNSTEVFELQGYAFEKATGMVMCRLVEQ